MKFQKPEYECPTCHQIDCFEHCNHCGAEIKWLNYLGDAYYESNQYGKRVRYTYNKDDSVHKCMKKGQGVWINTKLPDEYPVDEYRKFVRYSGPRFRCTLCGHVDDLQVMQDFHVNDPICKRVLMEKLFKEQPTKYIPVVDKDGLDKFMEKK